MYSNVYVCVCVLHSINYTHINILHNIMDTYLHYYYYNVGINYMYNYIYINI